MMEVATHPALATARRDAFVLRAPRIGLLERRALLLLGDLLIVNLSLLLVTQFAPRPLWLGMAVAPPPQLIWFAVASVVWLLIAPLLDCYDLSIAGNRFTGPYRAVTAGALALIVYSFVPFVTPAVMQSRLVHGVLVATMLPQLGLWRLGFALIAGQGLAAHRALIVGAGLSGQRMLEALQQFGANAHLPIGFVADSGADLVSPNGKPTVLGSTADLPRLIQVTAADELIVCNDGPMPAEAYRAITAAYESGVRVTTMAQLYESLTGRIPVEHIGDQWMTVLPQAGAAHTSYAIVKRGIDVGGALVGLVVAAAIFIPLSVAILLDSGWPIFFTQERLGRRGRPFRIYKFRTVLPNRGAKPGQSIWERKATQPTRLGALLRKVRLDELPQFWNVLKGDMSLVGPRPLVPEEVEELQRHIPFFRSRLLARPGLTGWAQIKGRYGTQMADELEKLQYDLYYVRHQSVALDLIILLKTIAVVLRLAGR